MKPKTIKITYWILAILFVLANGFSAVGHFFPNEMSISVWGVLGYPLYLFTILGIAKSLGCIAIIQTKFQTVKEWAFAGFAIDYIGAGLSFVLAGAGALGVVMSAIYLVFLFVTRHFWKRYEGLKKT